jgi:hypothetical protein
VPKGKVFDRENYRTLCQRARESFLRESFLRESFSGKLKKKEKYCKCPHAIFKMPLFH